MPTIYKRNCNYCGKYYTNFSKIFCGRECSKIGQRFWTKGLFGEIHPRWIDGRSSNKTIRNKLIREYKKNNRQKYNFWARERNRRKRNAIGNHTFIEWEKMKKIYMFTCPACLRKEPKIKLSEDHIVPLSRGGENSISNIQPLCISCNSKKRIKTITYTNKNMNITFQGYNIQPQYLRSDKSYRILIDISKDQLDNVSEIIMQRLPEGMYKISIEPIIESN